MEPLLGDVADRVMAGQSADQIAAAFNVSIVTVYEWLRRPAVRQYVAYLKANRARERREAFTRTANEVAAAAARKISELMKCADPKIRKQAFKIRRQYIVRHAKQAGISRERINAFIAEDKQIESGELIVGTAQELVQNEDTLQNRTKPDISGHFSPMPKDLAYPQGSQTSAKPDILDRFQRTYNVKIRGSGHFRT